MTAPLERARTAFYRIAEHPSAVLEHDPIKAAILAFLDTDEGMRDRLQLSAGGTQFIADAMHGIIRQVDDVLSRAVMARAIEAVLVALRKEVGP